MIYISLLTLGLLGSIVVILSCRTTLGFLMGTCIKGMFRWMVESGVCVWDSDWIGFQFDM